MKIIRTVSDMQAKAAQWTRDGLRIGLVPTMGYLHEGHLFLVRIANQRADVTVVSITVGFAVPMLYAGWSLFGKALRGGYSAVVTLTWAFGIAALILLPCQGLSGGLIPPPLPARAYLWFAGLIAISTVFAFFIFTFALGRLPAGIAAILVMSEIAFAVCYARLMLGEVLDPLEIAGSVLVVVGAIILLVPGIRRSGLTPD